MASSASSGSLMLQSPDTASLATDWIREWHVTFPDMMQWWLGRTFKCWWWKNHYLFSPWTASVILCSCIIFAMPRSLLWNNMFLRLACFQISYLLKLEVLRSGGRYRDLGGIPHNEEQQLLSSKVGDHCRRHHNQQLDNSLQERFGVSYVGNPRTTV